MSDHIDKTYKKLLEIRKKSDLKLAPNKYMNPEFDPRYYQIIGAIHMFMVKRFILGDDTGLGKTYQTIIAYCLYKMKNPDAKLMIICPSSVMYQWASEIDKFTVGLTSQIVESVDIKYVNGKKLKSKDYLKSFESRKYQFNQWLKNKNDVLIFNYNTMTSDWHVLEKLLKNFDFMVIFDEATAFKNSKSNTWRYAKEVSYAADRVYGLSATIIKNDLIEAFSIFRVIMPIVLGNETQFKRNYCLLEKQQLWKGKGKRGKVVQKIVGYKNLAYFNKAIDPYYLGRKKDIVAKDLPKIISKEVRVQMTPKQQQLYDEALEGFIDFDKFNFDKAYKLIDDMSESDFESKEIKQIDKLTALIYCQQIANSPKTMEINAPSGKEEEMLRILKEELYKEKVVIYTRFKKMVDRLEDLITTKLKQKVVKITGDIKNEQREEFKNKFNTTNDHNIMIINSAAKEGVNLQSSGYLVFYDLPFSYGDFLQIIGRIHRIGSEHENIFLVYMMAQNTVDEKTYDILSKKKELFDQVLGDSAVGAIQAKEDSFVNDLFTIMKEDAENKNKILT